MLSSPFVQLDIDFRVHFPAALNKFKSEFPKWVKGILAAARLSRKNDIVELLHEYDSTEYSPDVAERDIVYAILLLLHLLPSSNTRQKAKISSIELEQCLITFKPRQTELGLFASQNVGLQKQPLLICLGSKEDPGVFYLLLDSKPVFLGSCGVLRAVDALFKCHYVYWVGSMGNLLSSSWSFCRN